MSTYSLQIQVYLGIILFSDLIHGFTENRTHRERSVCMVARSEGRQAYWWRQVLDFHAGKVASL